MNKLTKLLSVFIIAGAVGTGVAGISACKNGGGNEGGHKHNYTWVDDENGKCHEHCAVDGCDAPDKAAQDHVDTNNDNKCDHCGAELFSGEELEVPANTRKLVIEGVTPEVQLSTTNTSHTIDKSAIKVYLADTNEVKTSETALSTAYYEIHLYDPANAECTSWEGLKANGEYTISVKLKNCKWAAGGPSADVNTITSDVKVNVKNDYIATSLAVKSGTLTQGASVQNKMSGDWTYTLTRANGDVEDYTGTVVVTVDTETEGTKTATLTSGNYTGTVEVIITEAKIHTETYAANLSGKDVGTLAGQAASDPAVKLFESANGNTKLEARGVNIEANGNSAAQTYDDKYFANRAPFAGATFTSGNALQANQRYFILTTEGAAKLTIYWSRNSGTDERGVSVFNSTVTSGDISALTPNLATIAKETLSGNTSTQAVQKLEVNIPAAGTYWITTANNQNIYLYYIELTTEFDGEGTNVELTDGETSLAQLKVSHAKEDDKDYVQQFTVGDTFTVDSGYTYKGTFITANTAKMTEEALTNVTYWIGGTQLTPGTTKLTEELFATLGDNTVTVKYGDNEVTGSYKIFVDSAVTGVTGISASLKSTVNTVLPNESAKLTLNKTDIEAAIVGENTTATLAITTVKYAVKGSDTQTEITTSVELGAGEYVIYVTATVTDNGNNAEFEATVALKVSVEGNGASWLYQDLDENKTVGAGNTGIAKNATIDNNGSFTAVALDLAVSGYSKDSTNFGTNIADSSNKPVAAASDTASGEAITFTNALAFDTKAGTGNNYLEITAKKATTIYVYLNVSDDKHGSNREGAQVTYTINDGAATEAAFKSARKNVTVLKVTLAAGDKLVVGAKQGTASNDPRVWFYGIEAVDVTAE